MVEMTHTDAHGERHSQIAPAFYFTYVYNAGKIMGIIKTNKFFQERLASNLSISSAVSTKLFPMVVPPKPWTSWNEGGYWYTREEVMRMGASFEQRAYLKEASDSNSMNEVFHGLDTLGETCWKINTKVFDIVVAVWNSGEAIAGIPSQASTMQYPPEPENAHWNVSARMIWLQECKMTSRKMQSAHSQRCDINYKLEIARAVVALVQALCSY
jgi:DNA-directed RNA polymerase, mitochondrial